MDPRSAEYRELFEEFNEVEYCLNAAEARERARETGKEPDVAEKSDAAGPWMPEWLNVDHKAKLVQLEIVAGQSPSNNRWNFNGFHSGEATIVVPEGYETMISWRNADAVSPHSLLIHRQLDDYPATFDQIVPAFPGAMSSNPTSMTDSTLPGESETIRFTASESGMYAIICCVPAHAATGMWIRFHVSGEGQAGLVVKEETMQ